MEINNVNYDGNEHYYEDVLLGVVVNVELEDGTQLLEFRDQNGASNNLTWSEVKDLSSRVRSSSSSVIPDSPTSDVLNLQLRKGQSEEGPVRLAGKRVTISANVSPDVKSPNGVIVAIGGSETGLTLFVKDRQVYGGVKTAEGFKWVAKPTPLGDFEVLFELNKLGLSLSLNQGSPAKRSDVGLFTSSAREGIDVGTDQGMLVGDYPSDFDFAGEIEDVRILVRE